MTRILNRPLRGRTLPPELVSGMGREDLLALRALGALPVMAGAEQPAMVANPDPFGVTVDADGRVVVDDFTNPISNIPAIIRGFARGNEGYWIEDVFNAPGWTVQGGAVSYSISRPGDHFLPDGQTLRPRAPGAEAPRVSGTRRRPIVGFPESISASIEVHDEARQRNDVIAVTTTFQQTANTFADTFQSLGEAALDAMVTASGRITTGGAGTFADWDAAPSYMQQTATSAERATMPARELSEVRRLFMLERGGVLPDTLVWHPDDAMEFERVYEDRAGAVLSQYGITRTLVSVRRTPGRRLYLRGGQVGTLAWEQPLGDPEYVREGVRKTDVYVLEGRVIFVANGADAIMEVRKT